MSSGEIITGILKRHTLKKTQTRTDVLQLFLSRNYALSHTDIESNLSKSYDRVTLYRTLNSFEDKGITHKVMGEDGIAKFALCDSCDEHHHSDEHIHFQCNKCKNIYCLDDVYLPKLNFPNGYKVEDFSIIAKGICKSCNGE